VKPNSTSEKHNYTERGETTSHCRTPSRTDSLHYFLNLSPSPDARHVNAVVSAFLNCLSPPTYQ
jgi:hypothetical protein